jgi:hypothetical protein
MADASLALAERRAEDLKKATERLGVEGPTTKQLRGLKLMGLIAPPASAGLLARTRGIVLLILLLALILGAALGIVLLIEIPAGSTAISASIGYAVLLALIALGTVAYFGRRRQKRVQAERADQIAARSR